MPEGSTGSLLEVGTQTYKSLLSQKRCDKYSPQGHKELFWFNDRTCAADRREPRLEVRVVIDEPGGVEQDQCPVLGGMSQIEC